MLKFTRRLTPVVVLVAMAIPAFAGMPVLTLGSPEANASARAINAVLTIQPGGCFIPGKTTLTATAVGIVNGEKRSIPIKLTRLSEDGLYAVKSQWPAEGKWVLHFTATDGLRNASMLVPAGPNGVNRENARFFAHPASSADVDAVLNGQPAAVARK